MKTYKYWIYYLKETKELYAYTDNKKFAKEFESDRDMNKFKKISCNIDSEEVNGLAKYHQSKYLKKSSIKIYDKKTMKYFNSYIIITIEEEVTIQNTAIQLMYDSIYKYCWDNPYIFKDKIIKALSVLEYVNIYNQMSLSQTGQYEDNQINIKPDELGIFIHYYGNTMKR